jgi:hypothetical protein
MRRYGCGNGTKGRNENNVYENDEDNATREVCEDQTYDKGNCEVWDDSDFDYANYADDDVDKEARTSVSRYIVTVSPSITSIR